MPTSRSGSSSGPRYAPDDPTLAKPWKELIDGATGDHYFWNPDTSVTQYHRPASSRHRHQISGSRPRYAPEDSTLPKPWKELIDGATGNHYFWNPDTNVTQYDRPAGCPSPPRQASSRNSLQTSVRGHGSVEAYRWQHEITMTQAHKVTPVTEKGKRGRGASPDLIPAVRKRSGGSCRDWSTLPNEIWRLILVKLPLEDYIRCAVVCSWLRSIARDLKQCSSLPRVPWLIESDKRFGEGYLKLFDMASNKNHIVHLPELFDSSILGSSEGWLIVADKKTADLRLLNPFSREEIHLPPTTTFPGIVDYRLNSEGQVERYYIQSEKEVTEHDPVHVIGYFEHVTVASSDYGYIAVVHYGSEPGIAFARTGDNVWTALQKIPKQLKSSMLFDNLLYTMDPYGKVFSFDFRGSGSPPPPLQVAPDVLTGDFNGDNFLGVLPGSGKLVVVRISYSYHSGDEGLRKSFRTFMLDRAAEKWVDVSGTLEGHTMFLAIDITEDFFRSMVCISAREFPGQIKGNCIYSVIVGPLQVWDNEDQEITRYHPTPENSDGIRYIPLWISPVVTSLCVRGV